jgi:CBS domain-containing protein
MSNVIPLRVAEMLQRFPPFSMLTETVVQSIARMADVRVQVKGSDIWKQGETAGGTLIFLARGRVEYLWGSDASAELVDVRDVGDLLGLTALFDGKPYQVTARVVEDCLLFSFPWKEIRPLFDANDQARNYVRRHLFWATRLGQSVHIADSSEARIVGRKKNILQAHLDGAQRIEPGHKDRLLTCAPELPVQEAARLMIRRRVPSMLVVDENRHPLGIVTHRDLVKRVIVEGAGTQDPVSRIMSKPVVTVEAHSSATAALLVMLQQRIGQVCITEDGTAHSPALDVCTEKDLLTQSGHHPAGMLREIRNARSAVRLRELCNDIEQIIRSYLETGVSAVFIGQICAELYDELVQRLIVLKSDELEQTGRVIPNVAWAWMAVGSDGRREQLLRTDMDNAMVWESTGLAERDAEIQSRLSELAGAVIEGMVECGFAKCQGGVMAINPKWNKSLPEWLEEIGNVHLGSDPDLFLRSIILFDLRFVAGNRVICDALRQQIFDRMSENQTVLRKLAEHVVATPPPLNFMGKFIVERKGRHEGEFDIKNRALSPLRGAAQALALKYKLMRRYSTGGRWEDIQREVKRLGEVGQLAQESYDFLLRLRTLNGLKRGDSGRFIDPESLSKLEKAQLSNSFDVVRMVQNMVRSEFRIEPRI